MKAMSGLMFVAIATGLGLFWLMQGLAILDVCPILCFANCECIKGGSLVWGGVGAIVSTAGVVAIGISIKRRLGGADERCFANCT